MMNYSYNKEREGVVFAGVKDINASFKDLCSVCDAIRYKSVAHAMNILEEAEKGDIAIEYRRHNKYMGSRHELGGKKGRWPMKCATLVKKVLINATANARNKGEDPDSMYVVHAAANKTTIIPRRPPKGIRIVRTGGYGYSPMRRSDIELARIEMGLSYKENQKLSEVIRHRIKLREQYAKKLKPKVAELGSKAKKESKKAEKKEVKKETPSSTSAPVTK